MQCRKCQKEIPDGGKFCPYCGLKQEVSKHEKSRGNGQGSAIKRGNAWSAVWTVKCVILEDGRMYQKRKWKGGFKTKRDALAFAANPEPEKKKAPTLRNYWSGWSRSDMMDVSASKQTAYKIAWKKLEKLADMEMDSITINDIQKCIDEQATTYYPAKDMKVVLSHMFKRAVAEGNARTNLADFIRLPKLEEKEMQPFTEEELKKLWSVYGDGYRFVGYILLMIYSGMMPGELMSAKSDMISWDRKEIIGGGKKTKKRKETPIVFPDLIAPVLEDLVEHSSSRVGYLLGMNKDNFYKEYYKSLEKAGVRKLPPYSCRHTTATALALGNIAPSVIQEVMRHSKFSTTQRYIHPDTKSAHDAINAIAELEKC